MFKSLDYNLLILIALGLVVVHLYFELLGVKSKLKHLENNNLRNQNLIENNQNLVEKPLEKNLIKFDNIQNTTDIFIPELGENIGENVEENLEENVEENVEINQEPQISKLLKNPGELEVQNEDSESEIPIYSNDNESLDELSINVTEKMKIENDELKDNLIENILKTYENKETNVSESDSDEEISISLTTKEIDEESDNEGNKVDSNNLDKDSLVKLKKIDLEKLAEKYNISVLKNLDGKLKKKTKDEIVSDLVNLN